MTKKLVGRKQEREILEAIKTSGSAELVALYGRRRIGKTFLVRSVFAEETNYLEVTGKKGGNQTVQLSSFAQAYSERFLDSANIELSSWGAAFDLIYKKAKSVSTPFVLFLDELPWLAAKRSNLLAELDHIWNTKLSLLNNIKIILCGSAASWILKRIVHAKGSLHNRLSQIISLEPFCLSEVEHFLSSRNITLSRDQIISVYFATGGVPFYLEGIRPGKSSAQIVQDLCFSKNGILFKEFESLFSSLFDEDRGHEKIARVLARHRYGLRRSDLAEKSGFSEGGSLSRVLTELSASGFIRRYVPFAGSKNNAFYRLVDEYALFYCTWIQNAKEQELDTSNDYWLRLASTPKFATWSGYAFELLCFKHVSAIKRALGISGIHVNSSVWRYVGDENTPGAQIDLILDRADRYVNLCEIKYNTGGLQIDGKLRNQLLRRQAIFKEVTATKKALGTVLISSGGYLSAFTPDSSIIAGVSGDDLFL